MIFLFSSINSIHVYERAPDGTSHLVRPEMQRVLIQFPGPVDNSVFGNAREMDLPKAKVFIKAPFTTKENASFLWLSAKAIFTVVDAASMFDSRIEEHKPAESQDADLAALLSELQIPAGANMSYDEDNNDDEDSEDDDYDSYSHTVYMQHDLPPRHRKKEESSRRRTYHEEPAQRNDKELDKHRREEANKQLELERRRHEEACKQLELERRRHEAEFTAADNALKAQKLKMVATVDAEVQRLQQQAATQLAAERSRQEQELQQQAAAERSRQEQELQQQAAAQLAAERSRLEQELQQQAAAQLAAERSRQEQDLQLKIQQLAEDSDRNRRAMEAHIAAAAAAAAATVPVQPAQQLQDQQAAAQLQELQLKIQQLEDADRIRRQEAAARQDHSPAPATVPVQSMTQLQEDLHKAPPPAAAAQLKQPPPAASPVARLHVSSADDDDDDANSIYHYLGEEQGAGNYSDNSVSSSSSSVGRSKKIASVARVRGTRALSKASLAEASRLAEKARVPARQSGRLKNTSPKVAYIAKGRGSPKRAAIVED
jgi:hypothetical protein